jgi:hypothetical protein
MCDHVWGMPKGSGFGVAIGIIGVTWRSALRLNVMPAVMDRLCGDKEECLAEVCRSWVSIVTHNRAQDNYL